MYIRTERPLSEFERAGLSARLRDLSLARVLGESFALLVVAVLLFALSFVLFNDGYRQGVVLKTLAGAAVAAAALALLLIGGATNAFHSSRYQARREIQTILSDGLARVEQVELTALAHVWCAGEEWLVAAVGHGRLLLLSRHETPHATPPTVVADPPASIPVCLEIVTTRQHRYHLALSARGYASLPLPPTIILDTVVPNRTRGRRFPHATFFPGDLAHLPTAFDRLAAGEALPDASSDTNSWPLIQAQFEECFSFALAPGELRLALLARSSDGPLTVADLHTVIASRVPPGATYPIRSVAKTFYHLRAALTAECGLARSRVRPSTRLDDILPRQQRTSLWQRVEKRLGCPLPPLQRHGTPVLVGCAALLGIGILYGVGVPTVQAIDAHSVAHGYAKAWWFMLLGALFVPAFFLIGIGLCSVAASELLRNRYRMIVPAQWQTVGDLARLLASGALNSTSSPWTDVAIYHAVRAILARITTRQPLSISPKSRLVEDLGLPLPQPLPDPQ